MSTALAAPIPMHPVVVNPPKRDEPLVTDANGVALCACGCGQPAPIAQKTDRAKGHVKGQPLQYINGHKGKHLAAMNEQAKSGTLAIQTAPAPGMQEITTVDLQRFDVMDDLDAATACDQRMRALDQFDRRSFAEKGLIGLYVEDRALWKKLADPSTGVYYHSYDAWLAAAMPFSRSSVYDAKSTIKKLKVVPIKDVLEMPRCNAVQLREMSTAVQKDPEVIQAAKEMPERKFAAFIQEHHPTQHNETRKPLQMKPTESARKAIDTALEAAMWVFDVERREEALEAMGASWLDAPCEKEGFEQMTNRLAFAEATKGKRRAS